jgi:hypothetical protein
MRDKFQAPAALLPRKKPPVSVEEESGWVAKQVWTLLRRKKFCFHCRETTLGHPASSPVNIPTGLFNDDGIALPNLAVKTYGRMEHFTSTQDLTMQPAKTTA